jgi:hypothetical protein
MVGRIWLGPRPPVSVAEFLEVAQGCQIGDRVGPMARERLQFSGGEWVAAALNPRCMHRLKDCIEYPSTVLQGAYFEGSWQTRCAI